MRNPLIAMKARMQAKSSPLLDRPGAIRFHGKQIMATPDPAKPHDASGKWGRFSGLPVAVWNADGRTMTLTEEFWYQDKRGKKWIVPAGTKIDGASIPRFLWRIIGGPYEGNYRFSSIPHDKGCDDREKSGVDSWEIHRMFYEAMRCEGNGFVKSFIMWAGVRYGGPSWRIERGG